MKLLVLNLPYVFPISRGSRWPERAKSGTLYYPYWLCCAAGVCQQQGHRVKVVDCIPRGMTVEETAVLVRQTAPDYLLCETTTPTCRFDYQTITALKAAYPSVRILVGGTHATAMPEKVLADCPAIDVVLRREYDDTVGEIMTGWGHLETIPGIAYRENGTVRLTEERPWREDLDSLPFVSQVYAQFLDLNDYCYAFAQKPMMQIFSARGCPFSCNFCSYPATMSGRRFRKRSVKNFVDELEYIHTKLPQIREIFIEDDTFTVDEARVVAICKEIRRRGLTLLWSCNARASLTGQTMARMKAAGCRLLVVGYESGVQRVLDQTKKGITLEQSEAFARNAKRLGLKVFGCFMLGLKGDDLSTMEKTFRFAKKLDPDMCFFQQAVPFPGTAFYDWVRDKGYLVTEDYSHWLNADGYLNCLVDYPYAGHRDMERLRDKYMGRWYFSPGYIAKTFVHNLSWPELTRLARGACQYAAFRVKKWGKAGE